MTDDNTHVQFLDTVKRNRTKLLTPLDKKIKNKILSRYAEKEKYEKKIIQSVSNILEEFSSTGIYKTDIVKILENKEICTRATFYKYLNRGKFDSVFKNTEFRSRERIFPKEVPL